MQGLRCAAVGHTPLDYDVDGLLLAFAVVLLLLWLAGVFLWNFGVTVWIVLPVAVLLTALARVLGDSMT